MLWTSSSARRHSAGYCFEQVADASPVPVVIYNIPFRTGQRADADTLLRLAQHENIVGVKQSTGAIDRDSLRLLAEAPDGCRARQR